MQFQIEDIPEKGSIVEKCGKKLKLYTYYPFIRIKPTNCVLPSTYRNCIDAVRNFTVRENDVFLVSHPKCGTTWSMEMVWMIGNDLDYERAKISQFQRFPHLDLIGCVDPEMLEVHPIWRNPFKRLENQTTQRFIKSHLPKDLLPTQIWDKKAKVIFVVRNPKDATISNYHFFQIFQQYTGSLEEFLEATLREEVTFSPFWEQVIPFWNLRNEPNVLFIKYEDMKSNLDGVIRTVCQFLGKVYSDEQIDKLKDHLSLGKMKSNQSLNYEDAKKCYEDSGCEIKEGSFVRQGQAGGWKNAMTPEMAARFDEWTMRQIKGTGLEEFYGS